MYITEIEISDLRSFAGTQTLSLDRGDGTYAGWTVFAGRNGAGKSTLLRAIALAVVGPLAARSLAGVFTDWVRKETTQAHVGVEITRDELDKFRTGRPPKGKFWTGLQWHATGHVTDRLERWSDDRATGHKGADRGPWADNPSGWFIAGYGPYRHLAPAQAEVVDLKKDPVLARLVNLFKEAATLADAVAWLKKTHMRALEKRAGAADLRDAVLRFIDDGLLPDNSRVDRVDSEGLWIERGGIHVPLEQVSDGYRTVTALVVDLLRRLHTTYGDLGLREEHGHVVCPLPGVVLIDEIDAHMHVAWQQAIGFWLRRRFPNIQFLVTSHSPFICQAASPRGIIRLPAPGDMRGIAHVDQDVWRRVINGGADDAVMTELFGLRHPHSSEAEARRAEVAQLESKLLRGTISDDETERYTALKQDLSADLGELADRRLRAILGAHP